MCPLMVASAGPPIGHGECTWVFFPLSIGFLVYRYGPLTMSTGGGLIGTGVPLDSRKQNTVQATTAAPIVIKKYAATGVCF